MKSVQSYQSMDVKEDAGLVREEQSQYGQLLDAKIDKYMEELKNIEVKCSRPRVNQKDLLAEVTLLNDSILEFCAKLEKEIQDPEAIKVAQAHFRERTDPILSKSYVINRCRKWPKGQQGDFMTLEINYRNSPLSEGIGYYLDKYFLSSPLAVAMRERLDKTRELLQSELDARQNPKVLDLACGSGREVLELTPEIKASGATFTCLDQDPDALAFARDRFSMAGLLTNNMHLRSYDTPSMFDHETTTREFGNQDVIYSIGSFDYLSDDYFVKLLRSLYLLLNPGGKLIVAVKDAAHYRPQTYHWLANWDGFMQRTEDDCSKLLRHAGIPDNALSMARDKTGIILFYTITKDKGRAETEPAPTQHTIREKRFRFSSETMKKWQLSPLAYLQTMDAEQITESISQSAPYLLLNTASTLLLEDGRKCIVAEANFSSQICEGHYPGGPTTTLVDMGRAMDQAATLFACQSSGSQLGTPLLLGIDRLRAGDIGFCPADVRCVIVAEKPASQINTRMYLVSSNELIATMDGWKYEFGFPNIASDNSYSQSPAIPEKYQPRNNCIDIDQERLFELIPQRPPFLVISHAIFGMALDGAPVLHTFASFPASAVNGHFCDSSVLGPMHNSRCLAQSGMVLSSLVVGTSAGIPEVAQTKTIRCGTAKYFPSWTTIETYVRCEKVLTRGNLTVISVSGVVFINGYQAADTDEFKYIMIPREKHPFVAGKSIFSNNQQIEYTRA